MLNLKSSRTLLALAAVAAMSNHSWGGCHCSVPPAPSAAVVGPGVGWSGAPGYDPVYSGYGPGVGYGVSPGSMGATAYGAQYGTVQNGAPAYDTAGPHWAPGGYEPRTGSPVYYHDPAGGQYVNTGNPYYDHFGPGYHRASLYGHYRFPYYTYRAPWYYPGKAVYNRDTNFAW